MLTAWDIWIESLGLSPETKADHYEMIRRMIVKAQPGWENTAWLTEAKLAPSTFNKRLGYLKRFFSWAIEEGYAASNTFGKVKSRKAPKKKIHPLTQTEIGRILEAFSQRHPHYVPFVKFLLQTGVRTSEAIGIQWKHIDLEREEIRVCESLPKDRTGNGYQRKRKGTKTSQERILSMTSSLKAWLTGFKPAGAKSDDLLFHSAKGCVIDAGNFREDWKAILASLDIPYRRPYETRHTLLSHAIEQGIPITGVAYIAGHTDTRMVMTTYGHLINRPELPDILGE
jgi:integrase